MTASWYERLFETFDSHGWTGREAAVADAAAAAADGRASEVWLTHQKTGARLHVRLPADGGAVEALLSNPLDPALPEASGGFAGAVAAAHERVATAAGREVTAVEPVASGHTIAIVRVTPGEAVDEVAAAAAATDRIARETAALHRALTDLAQSWPEGSAAASGEASDHDGTGGESSGG